MPPPVQKQMPWQRLPSSRPDWWRMVRVPSRNAPVKAEDNPRNENGHKTKDQ